jgi:two-component system chemotaxis sensor kinase CheA
MTTPPPAELDLMLLFRGEVSDYLTKLNGGLLKLETGTAADPAAATRELNRLAHSMKGAARSVGLGIVEIVAHYMEDLFEAAMQKRVDLTPATCDLLYDGLDVIQHVVDGSGNSAEALASILSRLEAVVAALPPKAGTPPPPVSMTQTIETPKSGTGPLRPEEGVRVPTYKFDRLMDSVAALLGARLEANLTLQSLAGLMKTTHMGPDTFRRAVAEQVDALVQQHDVLQMLIDDFWNDVEALRLVTIDALNAPLQRMIRDLARDTGRQIQFDLTGNEVEIDRALLNPIKESLMHLVRNAVDHGLETPAEREAVGKPPVGRLAIHAERSGEYVQIRVEDDGRGLDARRIRSAAVRAGLLTDDQASALVDSEVYCLIFHPGLTTSAVVSSLSGRGLGMDIVRERIETAGGQVRVESAPGRGTAVTLELPADMSAFAARLEVTEPPPTEPAPNLPSTQELNLRTEGMRILVTDDSVTARTMASNWLRAAGFQVDTAEDGLAALARLAEYPYNALVADVEMPNMDGLELVRQVRQIESLRGLPIIMLTSLSAPEHRQAGLQAGADAYLVKGSFEPDSLAQALRRLLVR